jgi:hypothetical protein
VAVAYLLDPIYSTPFYFYSLPGRLFHSRYFLAGSHFSETNAA